MTGNAHDWRPQRVLVTGATGLIGSRLVGRLTELRIQHRSAVRRRDQAAAAVDAVVIGGIGPDTDWRGALASCDSVVHLAGLTPGRGRQEADFDRVNVQGVRRLVDDSLAAGIGRIVFVSSIFAVAEGSSGRPVDDATPAAPKSAYGVSKLRAEAEISRFATEARIGISLRPPVVYAARAKGNWNLLQRLARSGLPLPFANVDNRRSLIGLDNAVDAIIAALTARQPASGAYCLSEHAPVSLADILTCLRRGMDRTPRLMPFPASLLRLATNLPRIGPMAGSLVKDFEIDGARFARDFQWKAPHATLPGIEQSGREFADIERAPGS